MAAYARQDRREALGIDGLRQMLVEPGVGRALPEDI
jgi:hypothetical protein